MGQGHCVLHECKAERRHSFFKSRKIIKSSDRVDSSPANDTYFPEAIRESISEEMESYIHFYVMTPETYYAQHQKQACLLKPNLSKKIFISSFLTTNPLHFQMLSSEACCFLNIACDWSSQQLICMDNDSFISNQSFRSGNLNIDMPLMGTSEELAKLETSCTSNFIKTALSYAYLIQRKHSANHIEALNGMEKLASYFCDIDFSNTARLLDQFFNFKLKYPDSLQGLLLSNLLARSDHAMSYFLRSVLESDLIQGAPKAISEARSLLKQCKT